MSESVAASNPLSAVPGNKTASTDHTGEATAYSPNSIQGKNWAKFCEKYFKTFEVLILTLAFLVIILLFSIPNVLFALRSSVEEEETPCSQVEAYTGTLCRESFTSLQVCFSGVTTPPPDLNIPSSTDQEAREMDAIHFLSNLNSSQQCREAIMPFLCLSLFELCDTNNQSHTVLQNDCLELRDNICADMWWQTGAAGILSVCEDLPNTNDDCIASVYNTSDGNNNSNITMKSLNCSEGFYFDEDGTGVCAPECGDIFRRPQALVILEDISVWLCVIAAVMVLILAFTIRRTMLVFPMIFLVYVCIVSVVRGVTSIVAGIGNTALLCGSKNYAVALENPTTFCTLAGIIFVYSVWQIFLWMMFFAVMLFWAVKYPFHIRRFTFLGRTRYVHIVCVALALLVPLLAALISLKEGYILTVDSPYICVGRNIEHSYYTLILPVAIILAATAFLLVLISWTIFQEFVLKKVIAKKKGSNVTKGELKILILITYTVMFEALTTVATVFTARYTRLRQDLVDLFTCESTGASADCIVDESNNSIISYNFATFRILTNFMPVIILLFYLDLKQVLTTTKRKRTIQTTLREHNLRPHQQNSASLAV